MTLKKNPESGLTIIELVLAFSLIAILAGATSYLVGNNVDAVRYEETRSKMDSIRRAILGTSGIDNEGRRTNFGYHGDMGNFPAALIDLSTRGAQAAWAYDATLGIGIGWRGPYYSPTFTTELDVTKDQWGTAFVYNTGGAPPSLTSYGAGGISGGTSFNSDLVMTFTTNARQAATVNGFLLNGTSGTSGTNNITLYFASGGSLATSITSSNASGSFSYTNIPFGHSAIKATAPTAIGPRLIIIDSANTTIPLEILNYNQMGP